MESGNSDDSHFKCQTQCLHGILLNTLINVLIETLLELSLSIVAVKLYQLRDW